MIPKHLKCINDTDTDTAALLQAPTLPDTAFPGLGVYIQIVIAAKETFTQFSQFECKIKRN